MNKKYVLLNFVWFFIFGVIIIFFAFPARALFEGDPELLRITAKAEIDNRSRIESWQGQAQVETSREDANGVLTREKSLFDFVFSRKDDATKWKWMGQERYIREDLLNSEDPPSENWAYNTTTEMRKGNAFFVCAPDIITPEGERQNTLVIQPREKSEEGAYSYSLDPMWYLTGKMTIDLEDLPEMLLITYRHANDPKFAPDNTFKVERKEDFVIFETRIEHLINRHTFDLSKSGCMVEYYGANKDGTELRKWTYEQQDGVWIPKTFILSYKTNIPGYFGQTNITRIVNFINNILNQHVSSSEFSIKSLGLKDGGRISDQRAKRLLNYHEEEEEQLSQELGLLTKGDNNDMLIPEYMEPLKNKSLPDVKNLGLDLSPSYIDKKMLICFFDINQRPSRNCILELNKKAQEFQLKGIEIFAVQVSKIVQVKLDEWIKENNINFPAGMIKENEEQTCFNWGVKALSWLILTDKEHIVTAEGFSMNELDEKIKN